MDHKLDCDTCKRTRLCETPCAYEPSLIKVLLHSLKYKMLYKLTDDEYFKL